MVEPIVEPTALLSAEEIRVLPQDERGKRVESSVLALINANGNRGLTLAEIERATNYPKNTLYKHVELLYAKRKINKIIRGRTGIFYPNGQPYHKAEFKDIIAGKTKDRLFGTRLLENIDGRYLYLQERELDENGFPLDVGGILIPVDILPELIDRLQSISQTLQTLAKESRSSR